MAIFVGGDVPGYRCASLLQMNTFTRHCISNFHIELPTFIVPPWTAFMSWKNHVYASSTPCNQGLYCPALSHSRGREEVGVGFNLLKIQQLMFCLVIYNTWFLVAFLGAKMFEVHRGQTVPFIHQWGGTITNSLRLVIG